MKTTWDITWIDDRAELEKIMPALESAKILSVDTETSGWQTGNEQLCLIQIGIPDTEQIYLIDALQCKDWEMIAPVLSEPKPAIIAHNATFEDRQFARHGIKMRGVIDTLKMAKKLRADLPNKTLKTCCKYVLGVDMSKEEQGSDWSVRPLTSSQIEYAAFDAEITYKLYEEFAALEDKLSINAEDEVPVLMQQLHEAERQYFTLIENIAADLEQLKLRKQILKDAIRSKLVDGAEPYEGEYGSAKIQRVKMTQVAPDKVRELMPEIADLVIQESVQQKKLKEVMEEHGIDKRMLSKVQELLRYNDRLKLTLADI